MTRKDEVVRTLEGEILRGVLPPGERLDETELARRFSTSRTPIREAFRVLALSGLVEVRPRRSAVVTRLTVPRLIEMFEVMGQLEGMCARLACGRMSAGRRAALVAANVGCASAQEAEDEDGFVAANTAFHDIIAEAAGNRFLVEQTVALRARLSAYRRQVTYQPGRMNASILEHRRIIGAIAALDPPAADLAMRRHVELLGSGVSDLVAALGPEASADDEVAEVLAFVGNLG